MSIEICAVGRQKFKNFIYLGQEISVSRKIGAKILLVTFFYNQSSEPLKIPIKDSKTNLTK